MASWQSNPLQGDHDDMLASLERSAPVRLMATMADLEVARANEPVGEALRRANAQRFDFLPVRKGPDGPIIGLFSRVNMDRDTAASVEQVMRPLGSDILISADAPLLDFIYSADTNPCRLVLDRSGVNGLVTLSDIQRLPVRTVLFSLFIHLELLLTEALRAKLGPEKLPFEFLSENRAQDARKRWEDATQSGMDRESLNSLLFADKKTVAEKQRLFGLSRTKINSDLGQIEEHLRNPIAHGADFLRTDEDATKLVSAARLVREWIQRARADMPVRAT